MLECKKHILEEYPNEACGIIYNNQYYRCRNVSSTPENSFIISPIDLAYILENAGIDYIVHSHCNKTAIPSNEDLEIMSLYKYDWIIYSCINGKIVDKKVYDNAGKEI